MSVDYKVRQIYNVVIKEVTETQESWKSVLRLAGQIYRYEFDNVLMVYAQKPHATLVWCCTIKIDSLFSRILI